MQSIQLATQFNKLICSSKFEEAINLLEHNDIRLSHINIHGSTISECLYKEYSDYIKYSYTSTFTDEHITYLPTILKKLISKEPHYIFHKNHDMQFLLLYMLNLKEEQYVLDLIKENKEFFKIEDSAMNYYLNSNTSFDFLKQFISLTKLEDTINIYQLSDLVSKHPDLVKEIFEYFSEQTQVVSKLKEESVIVDFIQYLFNKDLDNIVQIIQYTFDLLKPYLIEKSPNNDKPHLVNIMKNILYSNNSVEVEKDKIISMLPALANFDKTIPLNSYFNHNSFRFLTPALGLVNLENINNMKFDKKEDENNKGYLFKTSQHYFCNLFSYFAFKPLVLNMSIENVVDENNFSYLLAVKKIMPEQLKENYELFKEGMEVLGLDINKSKNTQFQKIILFLELEYSLPKTITTSKKAKI